MARSIQAGLTEIVQISILNLSIEVQTESGNFPQTTVIRTKIRAKI